MQKKQVSFRLEMEAVDLVEYLSKTYSRLTQTDIFDMAIKKFLLDAIPRDAKWDPEGKEDRTIGKYMRGELDQKILDLHKEICKNKKKS